MSEACAVPKCGGSPHARGVCWRHWQRASWSLKRGDSWRVALSEVGVPSARLDAIERGEAPTHDHQEEPMTETDAPTCETCGKEIPWGRGQRPRWCAEHRVEGRRAAAAARLKARVAPAPEVEEEPAGEEPSTDPEPSQDAADEVEEAGPSPSGEALPDLVKRLRRALPRHARDAFVVGYLLGRGGS